MKRLTSILLALLMLIGMALAEETPDAALGDWYALNVDGTTECLTLREDGTFCYDSREGTWRKTTDGEYWLTFSRTGHDGIADGKRLGRLLRQHGGRRGGAHGAGCGRIAECAKAED